MLRVQNARDPVEFLEAVMSTPTVIPMLRVHAVTQLLKVPKNNVRYLSKAIDIPLPTNIAEARE
jgi:hypothetical protein